VKEPSDPRSTQSVSPHTVIAVGLGLMWIFGAVLMGVEWQKFVETVAIHGVLPSRMLNVLWVVPGLQLLTGAGMLFFSTQQRTRAVVCFCGFVMIAAFTIYVFRLSSEIVVRAGCGCLKPLVVQHSKGLSLAWNVTLAFMHLVPVMGLNKKQ
jgi:hypothetical protein